MAQRELELCLCFGRRNEQHARGHVAVGLDRNAMQQLVAGCKVRVFVSVAGHVRVWVKVSFRFCMRFQCYAINFYV
jgi:hypothetical protein